MGANKGLWVRFLSVSFALGMAIPAQASPGSLLLSLDLSVTPKTFDQVKDEISAHSKLLGAYLSLGESHLEEETNHAVQKLLAARYFDNPSVGPIKFCSEKIDSFLVSPEGKWLQQNVQATEVYLGNNPYVTDFNDCTARRYKRYVVYSGFFHQNQFAKPFPEEFPATAVVTDSGNNIRDQMDGRQGFFVSQVEFPAFEIYETSRVFYHFGGDQVKFEDEIKSLISKGNELRSLMKPILPGETAYSQKNGVFLDQRFFEASGAEALPEKSAYILVTDLEYRKAKAGFYFLRKILDLPAEDRARLVKMLNSWSPYYTQADQTPKAGSPPFTMTFGLFPQVYTGESAQLSLTKGNQIVSLTMGADDSALTCVAAVRDQEENSVPAPCSEILKKFNP